ncbi:hypothetical protein SNOG_11228 [Parastagonospora nodorum SN15]|uniref:Uncharacterized protein n=1 Tax=Phaeosphaeria nodorum (strain SN15 / ATCC MYA-4574 / FGSC 10173) TaxID=321614 RepID=Q0UAI6_PHANO|nr:hypothetical protein SNOG_11228 [Parastagonospora nodorum SN15]EAT81727.1 hypothetical protein SNOG_11228 [Parastagonospora nodorum SN15]
MTDRSQQRNASQYRYKRQAAAAPGLQFTRCCAASTNPIILFHDSSPTLEKRCNM